MKISNREFFKFYKKGCASVVLTAASGTIFLSGANAQSVTNGSGSVQAVRVVCMAEQMETLLDREMQFLHMLAGISDVINGDYNSKNMGVVAKHLKSVYPPVGPWSFFPVAAGFLVGHRKENGNIVSSFVVTNWQVAAACRTNSSKRVQLGIIEPTGREVQPILADLVTRNKNEEVVPIRALCKDDTKPCDVDLPVKKKQPISLNDLLTQQKNLRMFVPDVAVLETRQPLGLGGVQPVTFNTSPLQQNEAKALVMAGFPQAAMRLHQEGSGTRRGLGEPIIAAATFSRMIPLDNTRPGLPRTEVVKTELMLLGAQVHRGNYGGPVFYDGKVVGMVTKSISEKYDGGITKDLSNIDGIDLPSGYALAIKAADIVDILNKLGIVYKSTTAEPPPDQASSAPPGTTVDQEVKKKYLLMGLIFLGLMTVGVIVVAVRSANKKTGVLSSEMATNVMTKRAEKTDTEGGVDCYVQQNVPKARLRLVSGPIAGVYELPTPNGGVSMSVGRDPKLCQLVFPSSVDTLSNVHCCFSWEVQTRTLVVRDMSSNGTYVNGRRADSGASVILNNGDAVDLGGPNINRFFIELV